jgi:hypothetical protein
VAKNLNRIEKFLARVKLMHKQKHQTVFFLSAPSAAGKDGL